MALKETLLNDLKASMKAKDKIRKQTITMIRAAVLQIEKDTHEELDDEAITQVIAKQLKQRRDAMSDFEKAGRDDLIEQTNREIEVIETYLPKQLSHDEIAQIVSETIAETGAQSPKDMGKLMKVLMPKVSGRADGKQVSQIVKEQLK